MGLLSNCKVCGKLLFDDERRTHRCPPRWLYWLPDEDETEEEDSRGVRAHHASTAAEMVAERWDYDGELEIVNSDGDRDLIVAVRKPGSDRVRHFRVSGRIEYIYSADEIDPDPQWTPYSCDGSGPRLMDAGEAGDGRDND